MGINKELMVLLRNKMPAFHGAKRNRQSWEKENLHAAKLSLKTKTYTVS